MNNSTPQEIYDQAYANFKALLSDELSKLAPSCICAYPRIIDFFFKNTTDAYLLKNLLTTDYLTNTDVDYGIFYEEEIYHYSCKNCGSEYQHTYHERGRNDWEIIKLIPENTIGDAVKKLTPNYLDALYAELNGKENFLKQNNQYKASPQEFRDYLFATKP